MSLDPPWRLDPYQNVVGVQWGGSEPVAVSIFTNKYAADVDSPFFTAGDQDQFALYSKDGALIAKGAPFGKDYDGLVSPYTSGITAGSNKTYAVFGQGLINQVVIAGPVTTVPVGLYQFDESGQTVSEFRARDWVMALAGAKIGMNSVGAVSIGQPISQVFEAPTPSDDWPTIYTVFQGAIVFERQFTDKGTDFLYLLSNPVFKSDDTFVAIVNVIEDEGLETVNIARLDSFFNVKWSGFPIDAQTDLFSGSFAFTPDESAFWGDLNGTINKYRTSDGALLLSIASPAPSNVFDMDRLASGDIAILGGNGIVTVIDPDTGAIKKQFAGAAFDAGIGGQPFAIAGVGAGITVTTTVTSSNETGNPTNQSRIDSYTPAGVLQWSRFLDASALPIAKRRPKKPAPPPTP